MNETAESSGEKTADAVIFAAPCKLTAIQIAGDGTNDFHAIVYDNATEASGKVLLDMKIEGATIPYYGGRNWIFPIRCYNGLYLDLTGTGASAIVEFIPKG